MPSRVLQITYTGDASKVLGAQRAIDQSHTALESGTKRTGGVFQATFGGVMPLAAAAAGAAVVKFGVDSIRAFEESEQIMAQTEARLESTGGAANVTAGDVEGLAGSLSQLTAVNDEAIQASENLLLTFTKVRNEAGAGNDIFNQGAEAILNMATAMNEGAIPSSEKLQSVTIQVGKALNDPIKGLTALGRAGVQFTEAQREQIEAMVAAGDVMGAQKVILGELETQFGGAAAAAGDTLAGSLAKAGLAVEELQENLGALLAGPIAALAGAAADVAGFLADPIGFMREQSEATEQLRLNIEHLVTQYEEGRLGAAQLVEKVNELTQAEGFQFEASEELARAARVQSAETDRLAGLAAYYAEQADDATDSTRGLRRAHEEAAEAARDQRLAELGLADSFLGLLDSATDAAEAQRELNRLERAGKEETAAYREQVVEAIQAQLGLDESLLSYAQDLVDAGQKQRDVERDVRDYADALGISEDAVDDVIRKIRSYIQALNDVPTAITTTLSVERISHGLGGGFTGQHGVNAIVRRPTLFLAGEAFQTERVAIAPIGAGARAGVAGEPSVVNHITLTVNVDTLLGGTPGELGRLIRDELLDLERGNVTTGLGAFG